MSNIKISQLPAGISPNGSELIIAVQSGSNVKLTLTQVIGLVGSGYQPFSDNLTTLAGNDGSNLFVGSNLLSDYFQVNGIPNFFINGNALIHGDIGALVQGLITLTTTGTHGAATLDGTTLNIPNYIDQGESLSLGINSSGVLTYSGSVLDLVSQVNSGVGIVQLNAGAYPALAGDNITVTMGGEGSQPLSILFNGNGFLSIFKIEIKNGGAMFDAGAHIIDEFGINSIDPNARQLLATDGSINLDWNIPGQLKATSSLFFPQQTGSAPEYVKGGMYFDTTLNKLRFGGATGWETISSS